MTDEEATVMGLATQNPYFALISSGVAYLTDAQISSDGIRSKSADIAESAARQAEAEARKAEAENPQISSALTALGGAASGGTLGFIFGGPVGAAIGAGVGALIGYAGGGEK